MMAIGKFCYNMHVNPDILPEVVQKYIEHVDRKTESNCGAGPDQVISSDQQCADEMEESSEVAQSNKTLLSGGSKDTTYMKEAKYHLVSERSNINQANNEISPQNKIDDNNIFWTI